MIEKEHVKMKLDILFSGPFPVGMASTNRLFSYAKGFAGAGIDTTVILLRPSEKKENIRNFLKKGVIDDVKFHYLISHIKPSNIVIKILYIVAAYIKYLFIVGRTDYIIFHATDNPTLIYLYFVKVLFGKKIVWVRDEKPVILEKKLWRFLINKIFAGYFFITPLIKDYAQPYLKSNAPIFILPVTVDFDRFKSNSTSHQPGYSYFCHVGLNNPERDGFDDLIHAFLIYKKTYPSENKLICIGNNHNPLLHQTIEKYKDYQYFGEIVFTGIKDKSELIDYMKGAVTLITTPFAINSLGFPSKIAEFLATGKPVITTAVGEISTYLDDHSAVLCQPGDIERIAKAMHDIGTNPHIANKIGLAGREAARKYFDMQVYVERLVSFLRNV